MDVLVVGLPFSAAVVVIVVVAMVSDHDDGGEGGSRSLSDAKSFWFCWCFQCLGPFLLQCCLVLLAFVVGFGVRWCVDILLVYRYCLSVLLALSECACFQS